MDSRSHQSDVELLEEHQAPQITPPPQLPPAAPRKALIMVAVVLALLFLGGLVTALLRLRSSHVLAMETQQESILTVAVVHPVPEKPDEELILPGTLQAYEESPIYARVNGYLKRWYKDIGSHVKEGDLLADIDTPEVDQELMQARATREQVQAALALAKINAERYANLRKTDSVSQEEADTQISGYEQAQANLAAAEANVHRLQELEGFKHIYSPFTGVLTTRTVDPGALINAGVSGAAGKELFDIARYDPLRVYVNVPQNDAPAIKNGMEATVTLPEFPGQKYTGKVARTAEAIDPATRTLLTEVDVPNKSGQLLPGSFGEVHFQVGIGAHKVTIPVNTMLFRKEGAQVAVVGSDGKIQLKPITIGRDYGATLEILGGVDLDDRIVINPADSLENGQPVTVSPTSPPPPQGGF